MRLPTPILVCCISPLLLAATPAEAQVQRRTNCQGLELKAVSSMPEGVERSYSFEGTCRLAEGPKGNLKVVAQVPVRAEAIWRPESGELHESVAVDGSKYPGYMVLKLTCDGDPIIGQAVCTRVDYSNTTGWEGFDAYRERARPVTAGLTTRAEVAGLLGAGGSGGAESGSKPAAAKIAAAVLQAAGRADSAGGSGDSAWVQVAPEVDLKIALMSGMSLATLTIDDAFRWALMGEDGTTIMRLYPEGSRALRNGLGDLVVDWGGGVHKIGRARPERLPNRKRP